MLWNWGGLDDFTDDINIDFLWEGFDLLHMCDFIDFLLFDFHGCLFYNGIKIESKKYLIKSAILFVGKKNKVIYFSL